MTLHCTLTGSEHTASQGKYTAPHNKFPPSADICSLTHSDVHEYLGIGEQRVVVGVAEARKTALWSLCAELSAVGQSWDG